MLVWSKIIIKSNRGDDDDEVNSHGIMVPGNKQTTVRASKITTTTRRRRWRMCVDLSCKTSHNNKTSHYFRNLHSFSMNWAMLWIGHLFYTIRLCCCCYCVCFILFIYVVFFLFLRYACRFFSHIFLVRICRFDIPHWSFSSYVLLTWHKYHWMHTCATQSRIDWEAQRKLLTWNPIQQQQQQQLK